MRRPGAGDSYADEEDRRWLTVDWPSMTRRVQVAGREMNVVDTGGDLPALVFVHGLGGRWQNWLLNIPAFMDSYRVIAPDLPGFGSSELPAEDVSIRGFARILDELLDTLGIDTADVVGNSMGGFVAAELTLSFSTRVRRLGLVSAAGLSIENLSRRPLLAGARLFAAGTAWAGGRAQSVITRHRGRRAVLQLVVRYPERLSPALAFELVQGTGAPGFVPALEALLEHSYREQLSGIEIPVLVVWGRNDMLVPRGDAREYVELIGDNARRVMFENTGHLSMLERPAQFNALLAEFLAGDREGVSA